MRYSFFLYIYISSQTKNAARSMALLQNEFENLIDSLLRLLTMAFGPYACELSNISNLVDVGVYIMCPLVCLDVTDFA